jgi:hypothetical protein
MDYKVEISDTSGESFRVRLSIPFFAQSADEGNSSFHVLDSGFIKYSSGGCSASKPAGFAPTHIQLKTFGTWGIQLKAMFDSADFVNSSGSGQLMGSWATGAKPGDISWALIS